MLNSPPYCATAAFDLQFDFAIVIGNWTRPDLIGGIGVSGGHYSQDMQVAAAGAAALG